jgi:hypothetical protein
VKDVEIDFAESFPRVDFMASIEEASGERLPSAENLNADDRECRDFLVAMCKHLNVPHAPAEAQVATRKHRLMSG